MREDQTEFPEVVYRLLHQFMMYFSAFVHNGSIAHPNTSPKLYLAFIHRQKMVKIKGTLLVRHKRVKIYSTIKLN